MMLENERGDTSVLTTLFAHNTWANLKLLDFCEGLSDEQLDSTATGCYGTIRDTLWHTIGAEVSYVVRVDGKRPPMLVSRDQVPGLPVMKEAARWTGEELLKLALSAQADTIVQEREERQVVEYRLASLMVQAVTHSCEHRTQISTIITQLGMEPPDMSGWMYMEEIEEFREFEEGAEGAQ